MLGTGTHPSNRISFEPGLERGVPWGRDLFTFVTSAAGYMMRTLQKPRKNKPSKRQVNHRRFLHNMIQRKFAEIEAANHQLASALFSVDSDAQRQSIVKSSHRSQLEKTKQKATEISVETEAPEKQYKEASDSRTLESPINNLDKSFIGSKPLKNLNHVTENQPWKCGERSEHSQSHSLQEIPDFTCEREHIKAAPADLHNLTQYITLEDGESTSLERSNQNLVTHTCPDKEEYLGLSLFDVLPTSPVSPLSLDSYDFEIQMQPDDCQMQQVLESLQLDVMENLESIDSSVYLQSYNDLTAMDAESWMMQEDENQWCGQGSITFLNNFDMDNSKQQTDGSGGDLTGRLQQITMLLENSVRGVNAENNVRGEMTCLANCYNAGQSRSSMDCYIIQPEFDTVINNETPHLASGTWTTSDTMSKGFNNSNFLNHVLDRQPKHGHPAKIQTKYWDQQRIHRDNTQDACYLLTDTKKKSTETGSTLNINSDYSSFVNPLSSYTGQGYGSDLLPQPRIRFRNDSCLYSNGENDQRISSFEGVAQSFPAHVHNPHSQPVSTPPLNADWLFSNIVAEEDISGMVRSAGRIYC